MRAFDKSIFKDEEVIGKMLEVLNYGSRSNFILNVLSLIDVSMWRIQKLKDLISIFSGYADEGYEKNRLMLSYNPLMSIALTCELLKFLSRTRKRFQNECNKILSDLLDLGLMYNSKIENELYYERLILDRDFKGRTVL